IERRRARSVLRTGALPAVSALRAADPRAVLLSRAPFGGPIYGAADLFAQEGRGGMKNQCIAAIAAVVLSGMNPAYAAPDDVLTIDTHVDIPQAYMQEARFDAGADSVLK